MAYNGPQEMNPVNIPQPPGQGELHKYTKIKLYIMLFDNNFIFQKLFNGCKNQMRFLVYHQA